jgi:N6-adenosine-specific RNA methylase IME4
MSEVIVLPVVGALDVLAGDINREHAACIESGEAFAAHAYRCGELLLEAKAHVPYGAWLPWLAENFAASERTAYQYMKAAQGGDLQRVANLTLRKALEAVGTTGRTEAVAEPSCPLPAGSFRVIVADPPWQYDNKATRGAAEDHYSTMTIAELCTLDVEDRAAPDAHLYLWTTNGFLREAFTVMEAWGFTYKTCLTWVKPQLGIGNYFRGSSEHVLFGLRGKLPMTDKNQPTWFKASRTRHSAKPDSFYDLVEKVSPGPYLEMFSRRRRFGWEGWGHEA